MKNKFEMRVHERNMKIEDLKSQIAHSYLMSHTQALSGTLSTQKPASFPPVDMSQTATSAFNLRPQQEPLNYPHSSTNADVFYHLINGLVEKKF